MANAAHHAPLYRQSGVIAFRAAPEGLEVLLVSSRRGKRWVIPKGIVEPGLDGGASAAKEAFEEAGVTGQLSSRAVGAFVYDKWGGTCRVFVFLMRVEQVLDSYPESHARKRCWLPLEEAAGHVKHEQLRVLLRATEPLALAEFGEL